MGLIATAIAVITSAGQSMTTQVAVPLLSGALAIALTSIAVLAVQVWATPLRQRNALRVAWKTLPIKTVNIDLTLRDAHRRGNDLVRDFSHKGAFTTSERRTADEWADEVVGLMAGNVPDGATREFLAAGADESGAIRRLGIRVDALKKIIDNLP